MAEDEDEKKKKDTVVDPADHTDLFDLDKFRIPQNFADAIGVKQALVTVPVRKPDRQSWTRVHRDPAYRMQAFILELKDERTTYIVTEGVGSALITEVTPVMLYTAINRQGITFIWPQRLPPPDGRRDEWARSGRAAAELAMTRWVRVVANLSLGAYEVHVAEAELDEPVWPGVTFQELFATAFRGRVIDTPEHEVLKRLRGLA
jgi:hypothetical protein